MINNQDIDSILNSEHNLPNKLESPPLAIITEKREAPRVGSIMRELVASIALTEGAAATSKALGVSEEVARHAARGENTNGVAIPELKQKVDSQIGRIHETALSKLLSSLNVITDEKLDSVSPKVASDIAANMSRVIEKITPRSNGDINNNTIIFYAPRQRQESDYEVIQVVEGVGSEGR